MEGVTRLIFAVRHCGRHVEPDYKPCTNKTVPANDSSELPALTKGDLLAFLVTLHMYLFSFPCNIIQYSDA